MKTHIKICGLRDPTNIRDLAALHPAYMGFIFHSQSPRYVGTAFVVPNLPSEIHTVAVTVNLPLEELRRIQLKHSFACIQLHGSESVDYCTSLMSEFPAIKIIKSFSISKHFDFSTLTEFQKVSSFFLFDTASALPGGSGLQFNWNLLSQYRGDTPYFLSGGISLNDVAPLKKFLGQDSRVHALDLNSKFEITPGLKSVELVRNFIAELDS